MKIMYMCFHWKRQKCLNGTRLENNCTFHHNGNKYIRKLKWANAKDDTSERVEWGGVVEQTDGRGKVLPVPSGSLQKERIVTTITPYKKNETNRKTNSSS